MTARNLPQAGTKVLVQGPVLPEEKNQKYTTLRISEVTVSEPEPAWISALSLDGSPKCRVTKLDYQRCYDPAPCMLEYSALF